MVLRVFCDFDGTVCREDVGNKLFRTFAGEHRAIEIVKDYLEDRIGARECLTREVEAVDDLSEAALDDFIAQFKLDPAFSRFVDFCKARSIPLTILSDGLDAYVEKILAENGHRDVRFAANHAEFVRDHSKTKLRVSFPHTDAECDQCGNCKRNHMITQSGDDDVIVYVGDGISDRCPVRYADIVFAKRQLIKYCQQQNITHHVFDTFADVQSRLEDVLRRKRIKHRREAVMARREVFLQG
ncbi:MAG: MtnX-like HAD-IB family phosphatase [Ignavibacteriales bacterium]|nr:MtnX-like HAD-IB family phosphatase [Ignavibacteriales bacterium]